MCGECSWCTRWRAAKASRILETWLLSLGVGGEEEVRWCGFNSTSHLRDMGTALVNKGKCECNWCCADTGVHFITRDQVSVLEFFLNLRYLDLVEIVDRHICLLFSI